jgi:hypothetical protein
LFAGHSTVPDIVKATGAFTEDVEFVLNELEAGGCVLAIHRPLGVYKLRI